MIAAEGVIDSKRVFESTLFMTAISSSSSNPHNWESVLNGHPIFDPSTGSSGDKNSCKADLELSISSLSKFKPDAIQDGGIPNGRRRTMLIKDADLIVAIGKQVRMTSLTESQLSTAGEQNFKVRWIIACLYTRASSPLRHTRHCAHRTCISKYMNSC